MKGVHKIYSRGTDFRINLLAEFHDKIHRNYVANCQWDHKVIKYFCKI